MHTSATDPILLDPLLYRHGLSVLVGAPFAGKTMLSLQLIAALQQPCPNFFGLTGPADARLALLTCDQSASDYERTAVDAGADLSRVHWFNQQRDATSTQHRMFNSRDKEEGYQYFLETLDRLYLEQGIDLFIVEPLGSWLNVNLLDYAQASQRLRDLTAWLEPRRCALLGTVHQGKAISSKTFFRPMDRIHAGAPMLGHCASAMILDLGREISKRPTTQTIARLTVLHRHGEEQHIWIDREESTGRWVQTQPNQTLAAGPTPRQLDLLAFLQARGSVYRGELKTDWLSKQTVHSEKSLNRDLTALAKAGFIVDDRPGGLPTSPYRVTATVTPRPTPAPSQPIPTSEGPGWIMNKAQAEAGVPGLQYVPDLYVHRSEEG